MSISAEDFYKFYKSKTGRIVRRVLQKAISRNWSDLQDKVILGMGHANPYLSGLEGKGNKVFNLANTLNPIHPWRARVSGEKLEKTVVSDCSKLPFSDEALDHVLMVHNLEFVHKTKSHLKEIWRCLTPGGTILIVVPNRHGPWIKAEWTPFGHGVPFGLSQIKYYLQDNHFQIKEMRRILFMPPSKNNVILSLANLFEYIGHYCIPFVSGAYIIEVQKNIDSNQNGLIVAETKTRRTIQLFPEQAT